MNVEELSEMDRAATPGPWVAWKPQLNEWSRDPEDDGWTIWANDGTPDCWRVAWLAPFPIAGPNSELIAAMRSALPVLLDIVEAAKLATSPDQVEGDMAANYNNLLVSLTRLDSV